MHKRRKPEAAWLQIFYKLTSSTRYVVMYMYGVRSNYLYLVELSSTVFFFLEGSNAGDRLYKRNDNDYKK